MICFTFPPPLCYLMYDLTLLYSNANVVTSASEQNCNSGDIQINTIIIIIIIINRVHTTHIIAQYHQRANRSRQVTLIIARKR